MQTGTRLHKVLNQISFHIAWLDIVTSWCKTKPKSVI